MSYNNKTHCRKFILIINLALLCLAGKSQYNFGEVDRLLASNQKALGDDLAALISKDGKIVYQKEMGEFKIKSKAPVASCSKWLTAALVMTFVDEGKLSLDEKISTYLPIYETYGKGYITVRQCLSHETGIADNPRPLAKFFERHKWESLEEEVNSFAKKERVANPGTTFFYGNIGVNIAGRVLEVISKKKFEVLMKQRIFTPLNMKNSTIVPEDNAPDPSGGAISTAADYMNFLTMLLNKGMFGNQRILSEAAVAQMETIQTKNIPKKYSPPVAQGFEYGLGEWIEETGDAGSSMVVSCPALFGTWPFIDKCRDYACILFTKNIPNEQKKDLHRQFKRAIDEQFQSTCK